MKKVMSTPHLSSMHGSQFSVQQAPNHVTQRPLVRSNRAKWVETPPVISPSDESNVRGPKWTLHLPIPAVADGRSVGLWRGRWILIRQTREPCHISGAFYSPRGGFQLTAEADSVMATLIIVPSLLSSKPQSCDAFAQSLAFSGFRVFVMEWTDATCDQIRSMTEIVKTLIPHATIPHLPIFVIGLGLGALTAADASLGLRSQSSNTESHDETRIDGCVPQRNSLRQSNKPITQNDGVESDSHVSGFGVTAKPNKTVQFISNESQFSGYGRVDRASESGSFFRSGSYDGMSRSAERRNESKEHKRQQLCVDGLVMLAPWLRLMLEQGQSTKRGPSFLHHESPSFMHQITSMVGVNDAPTIKLHSAQRIQNLIESIRTQPHEITIPMLVIHGANDQLACPQATADFFDDCASADKTLHTWPMMRHELLDKQDEPAHQGITDASEAITHCVALWLFSQSRLFHQRQMHCVLDKRKSHFTTDAADLPMPVDVYCCNGDDNDDNVDEKALRGGEKPAEGHPASSKPVDGLITDDVTDWVDALSYVAW